MVSHVLQLFHNEVFPYKPWKFHVAIRVWNFAMAKLHGKYMFEILLLLLIDDFHEHFYIKLHLLRYYFFFFFRPQEFPFDYYFYITFSIGLWGSATQSRIWLDDCYVKNHVTYLRERINVITFNP